MEHGGVVSTSAPFFYDISENNINIAINQKTIKMTKLEIILQERGMSQGDLMRLIREKSGFKIGRDRISKICTGRLKNYTLETAVMISEALEIPVDEIVEIKEVRKVNRL